MLKKFNSFIIRSFIKDHTELDNPQVRKKYGLLEGWVSMLGNIGLFLVKIVSGLAINSISLIADAFHTLSDIITSIIVIVCFHISDKPGDKEHPYGHGRIEAISTLVIAVLLVVVAVEFLQSSGRRLLSDSIVTYNLTIFCVMIISAFFKEWMYNFAKDVGENIKSSALVADAWHHRTDAAASLGVGVGLLGVLFGYPKIDAILGIIVSVLIAITGFELGKESINKLLGVKPQDELLDSITKCALQVEGVKSIHNIEVHQYGETKYISAHIAVNPVIDVASAHKIADLVNEKVEEMINASILVHIDPWEGNNDQDKKSVAC